MRLCPTTSAGKTKPSHDFFRMLVATLSFLLSFGGEHVCADDNANISIIPGDDMTLRLSMPSSEDSAFGDDWFLLMLPKTIGERRMSMVNFPNAKLNWEVLNDQQANNAETVRCRYFSGVLIEYSIELVPHPDYVDATFAITNHTDYIWHDVWMFTLLAPHGAPGFTRTDVNDPEGVIMRKAPGLGRFVEVAGKPCELSTVDRTRVNLSSDNGSKRPELLAMLPDQKPIGDIVRFLRKLDAIVVERSSGAWMAGVDAEQKRWIGMVVPEPTFFFTNDEIRSVHVAPNFGTIGPDEKSMMKVRFYIAKGTLEEAVARMKVDRRELIKASRPARPKSLKAFH